MEAEEVRKLILKAIYSDEWLYNQLVLKGGNALSLVYKIGGRSSLDLDFSIKEDIEDYSLLAKRMLETLSFVFERADITVFDFQLEPKPKTATYIWWGGYKVEFKLISNALAKSLDFQIENMRRRALTIDSGSQRRKYSIEISKYEYVDEKEERVIDDVKIWVYSPLLLAVEKLRALLQQHPTYPQIPKNMKRSRARDLYDIWVISDFFAIKLEAHLPTVVAVFRAKNVDLNLLGSLSELRPLHMASWSEVEFSVADDIEDFSFYFDFVNSAANSLYTQWIENSP